MSDIPIGDSKVITWVSIKGRPRTRCIDDLLPKASWFWEPLQLHCVKECCGIEAFEWHRSYIRWVSGLENKTPHKEGWRCDERGNVDALRFALIKAKEDLRNLDAQVISSSLLNGVFDKGVFVALLAHIIESLVVE